MTNKAQSPKKAFVVTMKVKEIRFIRGRGESKTKA